MEPLTDEKKAELLTNIIVAVVDYFRTPTPEAKETLGQAILTVIKEDDNGN